MYRVSLPSKKTNIVKFVQMIGKYISIPFIWKPDTTPYNHSVMNIMIIMKAYPWEDTWRLNVANFQDRYIGKDIPNGNQSLR